MTAKRALVLWGPVVVYTGVLTYFSSRPGEPSIFDFVWDKALHAGAYAGLAMLAARALQGGFAPFRTPLVLAGALAATLYGAVEEVHQMFVPGRDPSLRDVLADAVGAAIAVAVLYAAHRLVEARRMAVGARGSGRGRS